MHGFQYFRHIGSVSWVGALMEENDGPLLIQTKVTTKLVRIIRNVLISFWQDPIADYLLCVISNHIDVPDLLNGYSQSKRMVQLPTGIQQHVIGTFGLLKPLNSSIPTPKRDQQDLQGHSIKAALLCL